ncbi:glycosyltransferase family 1 protein [Acuticoccus sp. I52.16.1]|uniref:glycosyltransferase family 4 protein n=1 Tax=Acuticoccus sp. I52.16.1 TaxID=2928472 RepID=UPI001FD0124E|nr:glycosyltransferase family 1 protein [Acuticoccus sp. I52.16.1]UOM36761.1 glycosyltransferase family 4 protein [Acuticoccus sp. I52.16.1]
MRLAAFVDTRRTLLPCTGVGRHTNGVLLALAALGKDHLTLLTGADQTESDGRLPQNAPLRALPAVCAMRSARRTEQWAKVSGLPLLDHALPAGTDWIYSPHDILIASRKAPVAITFHDARLFEPDLSARGAKAHARDAFMRSWMRRAADKARIIFTVSDFSKARLVALMGLDPDKVVAVGNGLEPHVIARAAAPAARQADTVIVLGGLRRLKGGDVTLAVAERLLADGAATHIVSIGGPDDPELAARAAGLPNLTRAGFLSDSDLVEAMAGAVALLFPSRYEGFGMPPIEAMALGIPVIAADRASLPQIVEGAAILIDPDSKNAAEQAVAALHRLRYDETWRADLVARGYRVARQHTWECVAERVRTALLAAS